MAKSLEGLFAGLKNEGDVLAALIRPDPVTNDILNNTHDVEKETGKPVKQPQNKRLGKAGGTGSQRHPPDQRGHADGC